MAHIRALPNSSLNKGCENYDTLDFSDEQLFRVLDINLGDSPIKEEFILRDSTKVFHNSPPKA